VPEATGAAGVTGYWEGSGAPVGGA
jgi:hypothetical protein